MADYLLIGTLIGIAICLVLILKVSATIIKVSASVEKNSAIEHQRLDSLITEVNSANTRNDTIRQEVSEQLTKNRDTLDSRLDQMTKNTNTQLNEVSNAIYRQLTDIRKDTNTQLDRMRETVDEKLQKTLNDRITQSFQLVNERLQQVDKGLGEMQTLATGVGDLKRVLSNVKNRGILGEVQLSAILADILPQDTYIEQAAIDDNSKERVDVAVKIPVRDSEPILLPIDAKFPGDSFEYLQAALEQSDKDAIEAARKKLEQAIRSEAKSISSKYIRTPKTTNFAVLFLPFEGLYAEVVSRPGLIEELQRDYQINVAGPSTMAAILNSLLMSYQTFAFQQRADEIQKILQAVKAEFPKYQEALRTAQRQINTAGNTIESIITTRTNVIQRKFGQLSELEDRAEAAQILGIEDSSDIELLLDAGDDSEID